MPIRWASAETRRWAASAVLAASALACGGPGEQLQKDLAATREELASQKKLNAQLSARVDRLETRLSDTEALLAARPATPAAAPMTDPLAGLPVVKLERPANPAADAPPLDTRIALKEPTDEDLAALDKRPADMDAVIARHDQAADEAFAALVNRYNAGDRKAAGELLARFADEHPKHEAADNALYLAGMALVASGRCVEGERFFTRVVREYPDEDAVAASALASGLCDAREGRPDRARTWFEQVLRDFPKTAEATQARAGLDELPKSGTNVARATGPN